jgi:RNA polymerase sigma-70 factor (ECF subfamily)
VQALVDSPADASWLELGRSTLDVAQIYAEQGAFLWKSLYRMGVLESDLPDALQEVLLVVHRRGDSYDGTSKLQSWLFGICLRVAATTRRKRARRREDELGTDVELAPRDEDPSGPEEQLLRRDAARKLARVLDGLEPEQRALFSLYELENRPCSEIADVLGVPVGTVHSRLHAARGAFQASLKRIDAQERKLHGGRP